MPLILLLLPATPPVKTQIDSIILLVASMVFLVVGLILGPVALCLFILNLWLLNHYPVKRQYLLILFIILCVGWMLFSYPPQTEFWNHRMQLSLAIFTSETGFYVWLTSLLFTPDVLMGSGLMAILTKEAHRLWWQSPFRQIKRKQQQQQNNGALSNTLKHTLFKVNAQAASDKDATLLGVAQESQKPVWLSDRILNTHMLIAGTTGSGKTVSLLNCVESFIDRGYPVLFLDGKGDLELAATIRAYAHWRKRSYWHFSLVGPSCSYNPLQGDYTALKDKIIALRREWSEEHYLKLAEGYLQTVFKIMQVLNHPLTMATVCQALDLDWLTGLVRSAVQEKVLAKDTAQSLLNDLKAQEEAAKHVLSLQAELRNISSSSFGNLFETKNTKASNILNMKQVVASRGVACLSLSPMLYPEVSGVVGRLLLNDLKSSLNPLAPQKLLLVIDEVSTLLSPILLNLLNQGRFLGLHIILTIQSLADLGQKISNNPELFMRQILANCNVYLVHKLNDPSDADTLAAILGTRAEVEHTAQVAEFGYGTGIGSARLVHEYLAHPDHLKNLRNGQAFLLDKNVSSKPKLILCRKSLMVD